MRLWDLALIPVALLLYRPVGALARRDRATERAAHDHAIDLVSADPEATKRSRHAGEQTIDRPDAAKCVVVAAMAILAPSLRWFDGDHAPFGFGVVGRFMCFVVLLLTWQFATRDYDPTKPIAPQRYARLALCGAAILAIWSPICIIVWLYIAFTYLDVWKHHVKMPLRLVKMYMSICVSSAALALLGKSFGATPTFTITPIVLLLGCVQVSHYLVPGRDKIVLGKHWFSWLIDNQTHLLVASAYNWGWANFIDRKKVERLVVAIRPFTMIINMFTLLIETASVFSFLDYRVYLVFLMAMIVFNAGIFVLSGICFWEYVLVNAAFAAAILVLGNATAGIGFGLTTFFVSVAVMVPPVFMNRIWSVSKLAWWDTPFVARVRWEVRGISGKTYGLYNNFMCPFERDYGRIHGNFIVDEKIVHGHLGIVWNELVRDDILVSKGEADAIELLKNAHGVSFHDVEQVADHERFLIEMFTQLNAGSPKNILPRWLRWLKAPGGQFYYWGAKTAYKGQEAVSAVDIFYTEKFFDQRTITTKTLRDDHVRTVVISGAKYPMPKITSTLP